MSASSIHAPEAIAVAHSVRFLVSARGNAEAGRRRSARSAGSRADDTLTRVTATEILAELEKLAKRLGVAVRFEPFDAKNIGKGGGLCRLHGASCVVIDARLPVLEKIGILSEALSTFDLQAIYLPPVLRARLERRAQRATGRVLPLLRPPAKARLRAVR